MKKKKIGICKICKEEKVLSYEHFPPRSAFNKNTRFFTIPSNEYFQKFTDYLNGVKPKYKINQGGLGDFCLCKDCNNFLGTNYVNDYINFAKICYSIIDKNKSFQSVKMIITKNDVNLKRFLKQVTAIFICNNDFWFTKEYHELLKFVENKESYELPDKYRFYLYLNNEGQIKNGFWSIDNVNGEICEFVFPPFGIVLNINNKNKITNIFEITNFKYYDEEYDYEYEIILNKYPTYTPIPLDFRNKDEI